jgi:sugar/nucleoside kinase (ribokinase family)
MSKLNGQMPKKYDVVTIDDALVDEFYACSEDDLAARIKPGEKGTTLFTDSADEATAWTHDLSHVQKSAGGGAANTLAMLQHYGAKTAFCGKLGQSSLADFYRADLKKSRIECHEIVSDNPLATGICKVCVTPDKERTMLTVLPNQVSITPEDVASYAAPMLNDAKILFTQAYRWTAESRDGFLSAFKRIHDARGKVAISLSADFCVNKSRDDFLGFIENGTVDILFANEKEIHVLYPGKTDAEIIETLAAETAKRGACKTVAITFGEHGSVIIHDGKGTEIRSLPAPREKIIDVTGAGDAYAAGVLYGLAREQPIAVCGELGSRWAAEVIQHYGARPQPTKIVHKTNNREKIAQENLFRGLFNPSF